MVHTDDWFYASNVVAKRYIHTDVMPNVYFNDVKLQMDAKLWAEEYNRHNPPKKVFLVVYFVNFFDILKFAFKKIKLLQLTHDE